MERKLRAILSADVVGYSQMMAADEVGTLVRLRSCLSGTVNPAIAEHHGRVVKEMGDGVLAEFASVVDAVRCAVAVQEAVAAANAGGFSDPARAGRRGAGADALERAAESTERRKSRRRRG